MQRSGTISQNTDIEACQIFEEARGIFGAAQFSLSQWTSNSPIVLDRFLQEFASKQTNRRVNRVLGLKWKSQSDVFTFDSIGMIDGLSVTKRVVLSFLARLYDPLGMAAPVVMTVKIIFQEMWKMGLDWDRSVSGELSSRFLSWLKGLEHLVTWDIPRCFFPGYAWKSLRGVNLEIFCDSSEKAYGASVYIRTPTEGNSFKMALVIIKSRVAPIKTVSLPRLELMGALLGLLKFVKKTFRLDCEYRCSTDFTIVLAWVRSNSSKCDTFVRNRVSQIQGITKTKYWFHVEGIHNPADLLTRGLAARDLVDSKVWLEGPSWLSEPTGRASPCEESEILIDSQDLKLGSRNLGDNCLVSMNVFQKVNVLPVERWSSFGKALRITDSVEALTPLTPSNFLIGRNSGFAVKLNETLGDDPGKVTSEDLQWKELQRKLRLDKFWRAWSTEYLRNLPTACSKFSAKGRLNVGSIVLIREDNVKRLRWSLGRVQKMFPGRYGIVRSVSLKTKNGVLIRPIQRLHNLEIAGCLENSIFPSDSSTNVCDSDVRQPIVDSCFNLNSAPNGSEDYIRVLRSGRIIRLKSELDK
ncbi:hypothetical protein GQR58_027739 [Nymphon striatum]|nr:hypothetical protein GQR58_027739 [Nymphon striatum]